MTPLTSCASSFCEVVHARFAALACVLCLVGSSLTARNELPPGAAPGFLIVASEEVADSGALEEFVYFKTGLGFRVFVAMTESIAAGPAAFDFGAQLRAYLQRAYQENSAGPSNVRYALLIGAGTTIPIREITPKWESAAEPGGATRSDWYYADLTGDWDSNGDGIFGQGAQFADPTDDIDLHYEVALGRLPFSDPATVEAVLATSMASERDGGPWKGRAILAGGFMELEHLSWEPRDDLDNGSYVRRDTDTDNAVLLEQIADDLILPKGMLPTRLYETALNPILLPPSPFPAEYSLERANITTAWNAPEGSGLVALAGHGSIDGISGRFWKIDANNSTIFEHPTRPFDDGDGQMRSRGEQGGNGFIGMRILSDLDPAGETAPLVAAAACGPAGFADFNDLDPSTSFGAMLVGTGSASAFVGAFGTTAYVPGWHRLGNGQGYMEDFLYCFVDALLSCAPRAGDAVWGTLTERADVALVNAGVIGKTLIKYTLYGDPTMSYWGNAAAFEGPWPMLHHDSRNSGSTSYSGPAQPLERWTFALGSQGTYTSPIVGADGTIYAGGSQRLYAINPDGTQKWRFEVGAAVDAAPTLTVSGTLYFRAEDGHLYAVRDRGLNGELLWRTPVDGPAGAHGPTPLFGGYGNAPRVSPDGTVYALATRVAPEDPLLLESRVCLVRPNGQVSRSILHEFAAGAAGTPALMPDGRFCYVDWTGAFFTRASDGGAVGLLQLNNEVGRACLGSPAIGRDGAVFVGSSGGRLHAFDADLTPRWHFDVVHGPPVDINGTPAVGSDGSVYFGSWDGRVYALKPDGDLRWEFDTGGPVDSSPALDASRVYVVGGPDGDARVFALDRTTGARQWDVAIGGRSLFGSSPAIGYDNVVYVVSEEGTLYAIGPFEMTTAPSGVHGAVYDPPDVSVEWRDNSIGETGFGVERRSGWSGAFTPIGNVGPNTDKYVDTTAEPRMTYFYRVRAMGSKPSNYSNEARVRTPAPSLTAPAGVAAEPASAYGIRLSWSSLPPHATRINVYRAPTATGPYERVRSALAGSTTLLDENPEIDIEEFYGTGDPQPGRRYFYRLASVNGEGESAQSAPVNAVTKKVDLPAPTPAAAEFLPPSGVRVTWTDHTTLDAGFVIERASSDQPNYEVIATVSATTLTYDDTNLEASAYTYRVRAISATSESPCAYTNESVVPESRGHPALRLPDLTLDACGEPQRFVVILDAAEPVNALYLALRWQLAGPGGGTPDPSDIPRIVTVNPGAGVSTERIQTFSAEIETPAWGPGNGVIRLILKPGQRIGPGEGIEVLAFDIEARPGADPATRLRLSFVAELGTPPSKTLVAVMRGATTVLVPPTRNGGSVGFEASKPCTSFRRGDVNASAAIDIADAIFMLSHLFAKGPAPTCRDAGDANDDGKLDIADAIRILGHLFASAGPLPAPFGACGTDPTTDDLDCRSFPACEGR